MEEVALETPIYSAARWWRDRLLTTGRPASCAAHRCWRGARGRRWGRGVGSGGGGGGPRLGPSPWACRLSWLTADDDDVFYLFLQKHKLAQRYTHWVPVSGDKESLWDSAIIMSLAPLWWHDISFPPSGGESVLFIGTQFIFKTFNDNITPVDILFILSLSIRFNCDSISLLIYKWFYALCFG